MSKAQFVFFLFMVSFGQLAFAQAEINLEKINAIIQSKRPPLSVNQFLKKMPDEFLVSYALQFSGFGLQKASLKDPRVFLFDLENGFVATFNNSPFHAQNKEIEILSYNKEKEEFELSEISFENPKSPKIIHNPPICLSCHQSGYGPSFHIRPIFSSFNKWKGFYGGINLENEEKEEEVSLLTNLNHKIMGQFKNDQNRYGYLRRLFPLDQNIAQDMSDRPNHQLMNLLQFYNSRSIQKKLQKRSTYKSILPWISLFYFDSAYTGISTFGHLNLNELEEKGCFDKSGIMKSKLNNLIKLVHEELRKNRMFFLLNPPGTLSLLSLYEGMGFPINSLTMSLGVENEKSFQIDDEKESPFMVIPGFLLNDLMTYYLSGNPKYNLVYKSSATMLSKLGVTRIDNNYVQKLNKINPVRKIKFNGQKGCGDFYRSYIEILEASVSN